MMDDNRLLTLLEKYKEGQLSAEEEAELDRWYTLRQQPLKADEEKQLSTSVLIESMLMELQQRLPSAGLANRQRKWYEKRWAAAAAVVLVAGIAGYLILNTASAPVLLTSRPAAAKDILPGRNSPVLTLADGSTIVLGNSGSDSILQQGQVQLIKYADGHLGYLPSDVVPDQVVYNTISTPKGAQYKMTLPDGTIAWLNSASSIHYPTAFIGADRNVTITGEVYFEVLPYRNASGKFNMPFNVTVKGMQIAVLGTRFNVKAYDDEPVLKTTLVEGAVRLSHGTATVILRPGNQACLGVSGNFDIIANADTNSELAWMNGFFLFEKANIKDIMRDIARWYDLEIAYSGSMEDEFFTGRIANHEPLSKVIKKMQLTNSLHFKLEGRKLTVSK